MIEGHRTSPLDLFEGFWKVDHMTVQKCVWQNRLIAWYHSVWAWCSLVDFYGFSYFSLPIPKLCLMQQSHLLWNGSETRSSWATSAGLGLGWHGHHPVAKLWIETYRRVVIWEALGDLVRNAETCRNMLKAACWSRFSRNLCHGDWRWRKSAILCDFLRWALNVVPCSLARHTRASCASLVLQSWHVCNPGPTSSLAEYSEIEWGILWIDCWEHHSSNFIWWHKAVRPSILNGAKPPCYMSRGGNMWNNIYNVVLGQWVTLETPKKIAQVLIRPGAWSVWRILTLCLIVSSKEV